MAQSAAGAFGRFMRALRDRRGLSLPQVCRLFEESTETIDKGSLSRLERGQQSLSLGKMTVLSRIYEVSPEVLVERLELDREIEQLGGGPETEGVSFQELLDRGRRELSTPDSRRSAYARFRDALALDAADDDRLAARLNLATVVRSLGKNRLALHELGRLERDTRGTGRHAVALDRLASTHRCLGNLELAATYGERAVETARLRGDVRVRAHALNTLANVAMARDDHDTAIRLLAEAFRACRDAKDADGALKPTGDFEVATLNMLSECYLLSGRPDAARRSAMAATELADRQGNVTGRAYAALILGKLDERRGHHERAESRWREVALLGENLENRRLVFAAEYCRYRHALRVGARAQARAFRRRLERLAPWVPEHFPLRVKFREMTEDRAGQPSRRPKPRVRPVEAAMD